MRTVTTVLGATVLPGLAYLAVAFLYMTVAKFLSDRLDRGANDAIFEQSNLAVALRRAGFYLAIPLALSGAIAGPSAGLARDVRALLIDGAAITALLFVSLAVGERVLLGIKDHGAALRGGNVAIGLAEFGSLVATGLIARGAFSGTGGGVASAVVFFALGQLALVGLVRGYQKAARWSPRAQVAEGNASAGLLLAGMMLALGILLGASVAGDFVSWRADLAGFAASALVAVPALLLTLGPIDWVFLPRTSLSAEVCRDRNVAAVAVAAVVQVALALIVTAVFV